jgi:hypothetical protein
VAGRNCMLTGLRTHFNIGIRSLDQLSQSVRIGFNIRSEFHMTHEFAAAFQKAIRIGDLGAAEEADVDVGRKDIDVTKRRRAYARRWMGVVQ